MAEAHAVVVTIPDNPNDEVTVDPVTGDVETRQEDGGVVVDFGAKKKKEDSDDPFFDNLSDEIDTQELSKIAEELIEAIEADDQSRQGYLANLARGLDFMGLELKDPKSTVSDGSTPVEGMSSVTNPLLAEAVFKSWANAVGEFLPAEGPVKIDNEGEIGLPSSMADDLAETLERDMNHYLTKGSPEYYPETSHMLLWGTMFGGSGIKKVYRCPLRRRPVSEMVPAKDFIVSDSTKDLKSCERITHRIFMRKAVMKRMQIAGHYRRFGEIQPNPQTNLVDEKQAQIQGTRSLPDRPEDQPYECYETQCELDIPQMSDKTKFKGEGLRLPFLVTIEKDSREIIAIRRDWNEDDEECQRRRMYVKYPYVPGPGFYGTGLLHMLGNASAAMTAAWRMALDAGMFASFPGGLVAKDVTRQNSMEMRVAPGEWKGIETGGRPIAQVAMGLPYKDASPGLMAMMEQIQMQSGRFGGAVDVPTKEGIQNVPVGTMLAHIEQATVIVLATHRGMHTAQSEEIQLLIDMFREHPEDFWRSLPKKAKGYWNEQKLLQALDDVALTPRSDPNTPSHIHRIAKALGLVEMSGLPQFQGRLDIDAILRRTMAAMREDPQGLVTQPPAQELPPDLKGEAAMLTAQARMKETDIKAGDLQQKGQLEAQKAQDEKEIEGVRLQKELVIHQGDMRRADQQHQADMAGKAADLHMAQQEHAMEQQAAQQDLHVEHAKFGLAVQTHQHEREMAHQTHQQERQQAAETHQHERQLAQQGQEHQQGLAEDSQSHGQGLAEDAQQHEQKLAAKYPPQQTKAKE